MKLDPPAAEIHISPDGDRLAAEAADRIIAAAGQAIRQRGRFTMALAGGSTPEKTYGLLAKADRFGKIDWAKTFLFFGDERFVPHNDPRSNYNMAHRSLIGPAKLAAERVFPIPTDTPTPAAGAMRYAELLEKQFPGESRPSFDLILLGLGDDGHTASLFPGKPAIHETQAWLAASPPGVLPPPVERITFTFPVLNAARQILFLVAGHSKATPLREVIKGQAKLDARPAVGVRPTDGKLVWLLDEAAAAELDRSTT
jgi:6-phosphogluconolactonase